MGFSSNDIKEQYMIKIGLVASMGILAGIVSSNFLGERLINLGLSISGLGINRIQLISNPIIQYLVSPILLISLVLIVTRLVIREIEEFNIISVINE
jgi:putative ABC transport system permease protein